jgi:proteasome alpha subunit
VYTQYGGIRPFGVSLLIGGVESNGKPFLFEAEPSGAMTAFYAASIGSAKKEVDEFMEKKYKESMTIDEAIKLAVDALKKTQENGITAESVEIAYIPVSTKKYTTLSEKEVAKFVK